MRNHRYEQTLDNWRKRLAGEKIPTYEADPDVGYYRLRFKDITTNVVAWTPVAYFVDDGELVGVVGDRNMTEKEVGDSWTFVCQYPIPEEVYFAMDGRKEVPNEEWPAGLLGEPKRPPFANKAAGSPVTTLSPLGQRIADWVPEEKEIPAVNRTVARSDNQPPEEEEKLPLHVQHKTAIEAAIGAAPKAVPATAEECALVEGSKNRIAELRLKADKDGKAIYEPIYRQYKAVQEQYSPIINAATVAEKALGRLVLTFRENERKRIAKEQEEADAKQREIDEANARTADRAIAAGVPEPAPKVVETPVQAAPEPVKPTYGTRSVKAELKTFVVMPDTTLGWQTVASHFCSNGSVQDLLTKLAQAEVNAGRTVPGTKTREGLI